MRVLTGRITFSAAVDCLIDLLTDVDVLTVGEPSGGAPGSYGSASRLELPASGAVALIATQDLPDGTQAPDAEAIPSTWRSPSRGPTSARGATPPSRPPSPPEPHGPAAPMASAPSRRG